MISVNLGLQRPNHDSSFATVGVPRPIEANRQRLNAQLRWQLKTWVSLAPTSESGKSILAPGYDCGMWRKSNHSPSQLSDAVWYRLCFGNTERILCLRVLKLIHKPILSPWMKCSCFYRKDRSLRAFLHVIWNSCRLPAEPHKFTAHLTYVISHMLI
jgi:hypothetical protein